MRIESNDVIDEIKILKTLDHPNIVRFYEVYNDKKFLFVCTEYLPGGELYRKIKK